MKQGPAWRRRLVWLAAPWSALGLVAGLLLALGRAGPAHAADWVVGACGLTIQACVNNPAVAAGDTIYVPAGTYTESVTLSKSVSLRGLPGGAATTILRAVSGQRVITITSAVSQSITLSDLTLTGGASASAGGGLLSVSNAPLVLHSLILSNNVAGTYGAGAYISASATVSGVTAISNTSVINGGGLWGLNLTVTNSTFEGNRCTGFCSGAGLFAQGALTLTDSVVQSNTSAYNGGGAGGVTRVLVTGGLFRNNTSNTAGYGGGGLVAFGPADISGTQFISNAAVTYGGGLFSWFTTTLTNTVFLSNSATFTDARGGGAYIDLGAATVSGSVFGGNTSGARGGGLYTRLAATLTGVTFTGNNAVTYGGGLWTHAATVSGGAFTSNECTGGSCSGGGLFANTALTLAATTFGKNLSVSNGASAWASSALVTAAVFTDNHCSGFCSAGGIWANTVLTLTDVTFTENTSAYNGGGAAAGTHAEVRGGLFQNNASHTSGYGGGGLVAFGTASISGTQFIGNSAEGYGAGLYTSLTTTLTNTLFLSNTGVFTTSLGGAATVLGAGRVYGGQFIGNQAGAVGGLYLGGASVIENASFTGNTATDYGAGGLRADAGVTLTNVSLVNNHAAYCGGGAALYGMFGAYIIGGQFTGNTVTLAGGGGLCGGTFITMEQTLVLSNSAVSGGGALLFSTTNFTGVLFQGNTAQTTGGAVDAWGQLTLTATRLIANSAAQGGGARLLWGGQVVNTLLAANTAATGQGHALSVDGPQPFTLLHTTIATPTAALGSAVVFSGAVQSGVTNTLVSNYAAGLVVLSGTAHADYNLFSGVTTPTIGVTGGANDVFGDPRFVNPLAGDYHLEPDSAARDQGALGAGLSLDFDGDARPFGLLPDIGYDESIENYQRFLPLILRQLFTSGQFGAPALSRH